MRNWVNFHNHTVFSLLDGYSKLDEYCERAKQIGQLGVAITDHGNMFGALDFYDAASSTGLRPFLGQEFYQARKSRFDQDEEERSGGKGGFEWTQKGPYHCGMIAYNNAGYHNLIQLSSKAFLEGYYVKPRIDHELLEMHHEGLVLFSGCLSGEIQQALLRDDYDFALKTAQKFQDIMGKDNFFIEVQNHGIEEEARVYPQLLDIAKYINAPIVATCDSHYTHKHDAEHHDTMLCINTASLKANEDRFKFNGDGFYLKSYEEMSKIFPQEFLDNTMLIYDKFDLDLKFDEHHFPIFPIPAQINDVTYLKMEIDKGARKIYGDNWRENVDVLNRIKFELSVIQEMGFANYFLVVSDIINWAKDNGILVGFGRGSVAGCLIAYVLGITGVDPLKYDLVFERFLVPGRKTMPDIDLDIDDRYREKLIEYTRQKYGYDHTAQVCTYSTIRAKKAVRDCARVLGFDYSLGDKIAKAMPPALFGVSKTLDECMLSTEFKALYDSDESARIIIDEAFKIEGLIRETGIHAAGLVVADKPIIEYMPVMQKGNSAPIVTQWDLNRIDQCGLLKIDFLGLRNLSIVDMCLENIKERHNIELDMYEIPDIYDEKTFQSLSRGDNVGLFQIESSGIQDLLFGVKPENIDDISAILALYRPGPMGSGVHHEYIERKHKRKPSQVLHPSLQPFLEKTYGLLLYQEQLLALAQGVAGFSVGDADGLRKAVGKKKPEEMKKWREKFIEGCVNTSRMKKETASKLFGEIEHHASYSFGRNHSISYSLLTYTTAFLKANYPIEFMAAALSTVQEKKERLQMYLNECYNLGIEVLSPSVNKSDAKFKVIDDNRITYGFSGIDGVGEASMRAILDYRPEDGFKSISDFLNKANLVSLDKKAFEHLVAAGAFDEIVEPAFKEQIDSMKPMKRRELMGVLLQESKELGVYITAHPFEEIYDLVDGKVTHSLKDCADPLSGSKVRTAGIVVGVSKRITRSGKKMYDLVVQDMSMTVDVTILPPVAAKMADPPVTVGDILIFNARIDKSAQEDSTSFSLVLNEYDLEIIKFDEIPNSRPIFLHSKNGMTPDKLKKISEIIYLNKGDSEVFLEWEEDDRKIKIKFDYTTNYDIINKLKVLLEV